MFGIKFQKRAELKLPRNFNQDTMDPFIQSVVDDDGDAICSDICFDFSELVFIEPVGVVVLSNLLQYLGKLKVKTSLTGLDRHTEPIVYLDDAGFFQQYQGKPLRPYARLRETTLPLKMVANPQAIGYLYQDIIPWIAQRLKTTEIALATVRVTLQEIFHNISDHSGVNVGCVFAQHFPKQDELRIAISDFGLGIPNNVRKIRAEVSDPEALALAVQEGFTTKSNVKNRGAGLAILMRYVTLRNQGAVLITSGRGNLSAVYDGRGTKITARTRSAHYPGTLVRVILKTSEIHGLVEDVEHEEFSW